jgi:hypothetical protein
LIVACLHASLLIASDTTPSSLRIAARFNRFTVCLSLPTSLVSTLSFAHLSLAPLIVVIMTSSVSSSSTASSAGSLLSIEKLTADNFLSWKQRVQALLMREKAWDVIRKPTPVFTDSKEDIAARAAWEDKDSLALADITLTLSTSQLGYTRHCKTAREAWSKLTAVHEKKTAASMLYLRRKMFTCKLEDHSEGGMQHHINLLRDMQDQLFDMGAPVTDLDAATLLLHSVGEKYQAVTVAIGMQRIEDLSFDGVSTSLLAHERSMLEELSTPISSTAKAESTFVAVAAGRGRGQSRTKCSYCDKPGHTEAVCYTKHGYPAGHPRHNGGNSGTSSGFANASRGPTAALVHGFFGTVIHDDTNATQTGTSAPTTAITSAYLTEHTTDPATQSRSSAQACEWMIDSGASQHLCNSRAYIADYEPLTNKKVLLGDNRIIPVRGRGRVDVHIPLGGRSTLANFNGVLYVPDIAVNLLSVSQMTLSGLQVSFNGRRCIIRSTAGHVIGSADRQENGLYRLMVHPYRVADVASAMTAEVTAAVTAATPVQSLSLVARGTPSVNAIPAVAAPNILPADTAVKLAHERMGHLHLRALGQLHSGNMATDVNWKVQDGQSLQCDSCHLGKAQRAIMPKDPATRATEALQLVHSDICGPMQSTSLAGARYFLSFIDDYTRYITVYTIKQKSEALKYFTIYKAFAETTTGRRIRSLRTDGGG